MTAARVAASKKVVSRPAGACRFGHRVRAPPFQRRHPNSNFLYHLCHRRTLRRQQPHYCAILGCLSSTPLLSLFAPRVAVSIEATTILTRGYLHGERVQELITICRACDDGTLCARMQSADDLRRLDQSLVQVCAHEVGTISEFLSRLRLL